MGFDVIFVFALIIAAVTLFMTEYIPFEITALLITSSLMVTGILNINEGLSGLSNQATVTIGSMFIISEGLRRAGILRAAGALFIHAGKRSFWLAVVIILLLTGIISGFMNNTAAVLFAPIAIYTALEMGVNPRTFIFTVTFAASLNFLTPVSYPTNALVYNPGRYKFLDYTRAGAPLSIIFWMLGSLLIPVIWPL